ncbi:MAG: PAS domain S-box protein [Smithellaceae bacterium]|nr:PAS domain S-box protein [Smithellaceae bacterium]
MVYLDLITNLALLVALSVVSGFIDKHWPRSTRLGVLMQGVLFGGVAVIGMLRPLNMGPGLIFDGRSVMISLCALFFGPWAASVAGLMTIACRLGLGGVGTIMGVLVILSSAGIGLVAHFRLRPSTQPPSTRHLYFFGLVVHVAMIALMFTLPENIIMSVVKRVGIPVILLYPLATILVGKILSDQVSAIQHAEALRISEEKYKSVFEVANTGKSITLLTGEINVNQAFCDMLGYTKEEIKNKRWQDVTPADDIETTQKFVDSLLQGKEDSARFNKRYTHKNGSYIWADTSVAMHRDANRNPLFFITTIIDITERKQAEEALRESEEKFRVLVDSTPAAVMLYQDDRWIYANSAAEIICGYSVKELLSMNFWDFIHPDYKSVIQKHGRKRQQGEKTTNRHEFKIIAKDGTQKCVDLSGASTTVQGRPAGIISILDITERKRAEERLKENASLLRIAGEKAKLGGWSVDLKNNLCTWSDETAAIHERPAGYAPLVEERINYYAPEWREKITKVFTQCAQNGIPYDEEMEIITANGKRVWIRTMGEPVKDEAGKIIKVHGAFQDITERKRFEKELKESEERYELVIDASEQGIWDWNVEANEVFYSEQWKKQIGYKDHELKNDFNTWVEHLHPEEKENCQNAVYSYLNHPVEHFMLEFRFRHKDGTYRWIHNKASSLKNNEGKVIRMFGVHNDITERKQAEEAIRELSRQWQITFDSTDTAIWVLDSEQRVLRSNKTAEKFFHRPCGEFIGKYCWEIVHGTTQPIPECPLLRARKSLRREIMELKTEEGWFEVTVDPILDADGHYSGAVHAVSNITARKRAEESIRDLNENLEQRIKERTAELNETIDLLEETNRAFVGRELRIIELKEQIAELEKRHS